MAPAAALLAGTKPTNKWIIDSGATISMVNNTIWLDNVRTIEPIQIATAVASRNEAFKGRRTNGQKLPERTAQASLQTAGRKAHAPCTNVKTRHKRSSFRLFPFCIQLGPVPLAGSQGHRSIPR